MVKLIQDFIVVLVTCRNEEDSIKNEGARVFTTLYIDFFRHSRAGNSAISGRIWLKFKLIQAFMHALVFCKNLDDPIKSKGARVLTTFLHHKSMGIFPDAQGHLTPQSLVRSGRISKSSEIL